MLVPNAVSLPALIVQANCSHPVASRMSAARVAQRRGMPPKIRIEAKTDTVNGVGFCLDILKSTDKKMAPVFKTGAIHKFLQIGVGLDLHEPGINVLDIVLNLF
jgi:hypothetical protein